MNALTVRTPGGGYEVVVAPGALDELAGRLETLGLRGRLWLIADAGVYPHYGPRIEERLHAAGRTVQSYRVPAGEASKGLETAAELYDWLIGGGVERRDAVLALGGGVTGDLAGFVAATVLRGIALVHIPTTVLALVDSAIGGKTGVNHALGKNLIGAFHQPRLVLGDTDLLATLPARELRSGMAEVIKHGVIRDAGLFEMLEASGVRSQKSGADVVTTLVGDAAGFASLVRRAANVKVEIVNADEREDGDRMLLNYGHTLGHAIETAAGYGALAHGEAVAIGMHLEAKIAQGLGMVDVAMVERQRALIAAYGLPTEVPPGMGADALIALTLRDKKVRAGKVRWALPTGVGGATVRDDVPEALVRAVLADGM